MKVCIIRKYPPIQGGMFSVSPGIDTKALEQIFRRQVLKMLLAKGKITAAMITLLDK